MRIRGSRPPAVDDTDGRYGAHASQPLCGVAASKRSSHAIHAGAASWSEPIVRARSPFDLPHPVRQGASRRRPWAGWHLRVQPARRAAHGSHLAVRPPTGLPNASSTKIDSADRRPRGQSRDRGCCLPCRMCASKSTMIWLEPRRCHPQIFVEVPPIVPAVVERIA